MTESTKFDFKKEFSTYYETHKADGNLDAALKKIKTFKEKFPVENLKKLDFADYCLGRNFGRETYSYMMEYGSDELGSIRGGSAMKHGVYQSNVDGEYRYANNRFNSADDAIKQIGQALAKIAQGAKPNDKEVSEILSHTIRYKTYFIYHAAADDSLPIYSTYHARNFCDLLGISYESGADLFDLQQKLLGELLTVVKKPKPDEEYIKLKLIFMYFLYGNTFSTTENTAEENLEEDGSVTTAELDSIAKRAEESMNSKYEKILGEISDLRKSTFEVMGIFASIITLVSVDVQFLKDNGNDPLVVLGILIGINTVPFLFYIIIKALFSSREDACAMVDLDQSAKNKIEVEQKKAEMIQMKQKSTVQHILIVSLIMFALLGISFGLMYAAKSRVADRSEKICQQAICSDCRVPAAQCQ